MYSENFIVTFFTTAKFFTMSIVFAQMNQFSLNFNSLQQKFSLQPKQVKFTNSVIVVSHPHFSM